MTYTNEQLKTGEDKAGEANDALAKSVLEDAQFISTIIARAEYNAVEGGIDHVVPHLSRALTNITRNPAISKYLPKASSSSNGTGNGQTPRLLIISAAVDAFKGKWPEQDENGRAEFDSDEALNALITASVSDALKDEYAKLSGDVFRMKLVRADVRKRLAEYVPQRKRAARVPASKPLTLRQRLLNTAVPAIGNGFGKYPVDNDDLKNLILEGLASDTELSSYFTALPEFNKMLVYADVRKGLVNGDYGILAPTKAPASVEASSAPADGEPVISGIASNTKKKAKAKSRAAKIAEAVAAANAPKVDMDEAVTHAMELYADGDSRDDVVARMREVAVGDMPTGATDGDVVTIEDGDGVVVSTTPDYQYVLLDA